MCSRARRQMILSDDQQEISNVFRVFRGETQPEKVVDSLIFRED